MWKLQSVNVSKLTHSKGENAMPNAVIYARYSSHSQRDVSIDQQVNACKEFAARGGIDVLNVYADRATTGTNDRRRRSRR